MIKSLLRKLRVFCCIVTNRGAVIPMRIGANAQLQIYLCQRDTSTAWVNPGKYIYIYIYIPHSGVNSMLPNEIINI